MSNRKERRTHLFSLIGGEICRWCRATEEIQFDHIEREGKAFDIGSTNYALSERLVEEVMKCQPLCRSCHQIKSALEIAPRPEYLPRTIQRRRDYRAANLDKYRAAGRRYYARHKPPPQPLEPWKQKILDEVKQGMWDELGIRY